MIVFLLFPLFGYLIDLLVCFKCKVNNAMRQTAIETMLKEMPQCENKVIKANIKGQVEQLAKEISKKYPELTVKTFVIPDFADGQYFETFEPAHTQLFYRIEFYKNDNSPTWMSPISKV